MITKNKTKLKEINSKNSKGITLIALVVTIIVLIILAGISISLVLGNNGIVEKAKQAKERTEQSKLNEEVGLNEAVKYVEDMESENGESSTPNPIPTLTTKDLKVGDCIKYDTGVSDVGTNGVIICRVLYDASSKYGLQIISDKNVTNITLGGNDWTTARDSYNNAIVTLNTEAKKYLNIVYATDARCVGSLPTLQNGTFVDKNSENAGPVELPFDTTAIGANNMKDQDENYYDEYYYIINENQYIKPTGETYWLASRYTMSGLSNYVFYLRCAEGEIYNEFMCYVSKEDASGFLNSHGFRPCFALKTDIKITGGDGKSEETAYTM